MSANQRIGRIKLMAEYGTHPIWNEDRPENIDPADLPIPVGLAEQIHRWAAKFEETLDDEYPPDSGSASAEDLAEFEAEGRSIVFRMQAELGPDWEVDYSPSGSVRRL